MKLQNLKHFQDVEELWRSGKHTRPFGSLKTWHLHRISEISNSDISLEKCGNTNVFRTLESNGSKNNGCFCACWETTRIYSFRSIYFLNCTARKILLKSKSLLNWYCLLYWHWILVLYTVSHKLYLISMDLHCAISRTGTKGQKQNYLFQVHFSPVIYEPELKVS